MELYALSKHASEGVVARWAELFGMPALSVRFSMVYGRLDRDTGARNRHNPPYWVAQQAAAGAEVVVSGDLDEIGGDYIAVEDVAEAMLLLLGSEQTPRQPLYHIAAGRATTHRELLEAAGATRVATAAASDVGVNDGGAVHLAALPELDHRRAFSYPIAPLQEEFGWQPAPLAEAMGSYVRALKAAGPKPAL